MKFQYKWHSELPPHILSFLKDWEFYDIEPVSEIRTSPQNSLLHGWIYPQAIEAFRRKWKILNAEQVHFFFKSQFLKKRKLCKVTGKYRYQDGSTAKLSIKWFSIYVEKVRWWVIDTLDYEIQNPINEDELLYWQNQMN